jgi:hypothetical protein
VAVDDLLHRKSTCLTSAHDRLLDVIAEHLVEEYLRELEAAGTTADGEMQVAGEMEPLQAVRRAM